MKNLKTRSLNYLFAVLIFSIFGISLSSCSKDEDSNATIIIKVVDKYGEPKPQTLVYMFNSSAKGQFNSDPFFASRKVVTEENGEARFELKDVNDLNPVVEQETFHFCVYNKSETAYLGNIYVTVKDGEVKEATMHLAI